MSAPSSDPPKHSPPRGVLLTPGSASPWNQKALRASAGSSFRLPVVSLPNTALLRHLPEKQIPIYACVAERWSFHLRSRSARTDRHL